MKKSGKFIELRKTISAQVFNPEDLLYWEKLMFMAAIKARNNAQAPYSHYFVGVAVSVLPGRIYAGCNVERASWTQTTHAEQNAIDTMITHEGSGKKIQKLVLVGAPERVEIKWPFTKKSGELISIEEVPVPCGHCLQIIWENCLSDGKVEILSLCSNGQITRTTMNDAFPMKFGPKDLGVDYGK